MIALLQAHSAWNQSLMKKEASQLLSSLGIKTAWSKIALVGPFLF